MLISFLTLCFMIVASFSGAHSKTITSTITNIIAAPSSPPASSSYTSDNNFRSSILNSTNFYRNQHNATALTWNNSLATYATTYANKCLWTHSLGPAGETLAVGYLNATAAVEAWGNERARYDFNRPTGFSPATGHFTQLVWKTTRTIGCGRMDCEDDQGGVPDDGKGRAVGWLVVCEYWPPGNVEGEFGAEVQRRGGVGSGGVERLRGRMWGWGGVVGVGLVVLRL